MAKPISPLHTSDIGVDGQRAVDEELTGNDEVIYGAEEDEAMAQFVPTGVESAQEADVRRARIAERPGTEAEREELVASGEIAEVPRRPPAEKTRYF